ncbi:hypothetical protein NHG73_03070 [Leuconostoc fallax]|nr:hypothetical protein [Leuconostoc fallax]
MQICGNRHKVKRYTEENK